MLQRLAAPFGCSSKVVKLALPASAALAVLHLARQVAPEIEGSGWGDSALHLHWVQMPVPDTGLPLLLFWCRGEGLGALEGATYLGVVAGLVTELYKVVRSITGGESG